jgi:hypothetical protein
LLVLAPDEHEARRTAQGMARITQATLLAEAAHWRATRNDPAGVAAADLFTRTPLLAEPTRDLDLNALAYGIHPAPEHV